MFLASSIAPTSAIEGGESALSENVVSFVLRDLTRNTLSRPTCSGGMIAPRVVVTAKHCLKGLIDSKWEVTYPGADIESKDLITSKIVKIIARPGEFTTEDDIALIVIDRDFPVTQNLKVANREDMIRLRNLEPPSLTYGYGSTASSLLQTYLPFKIENKLVREFPDKNWSSSEEVFAIKYLSPTSYVCGGDSGGPNYVWSGEFLYFIGPTGFATRPGCEKGLKGNFYLGGTAIAYKLDLLQEAEIFVEKTKVEELNSVAQQKRNQEAEAQAAAELKVKQEPVTKAVVNTKKTITCFKGKITKKVTAIKPKCPRGFKTKK
jgi:hypothetical protein